MWFIEDVFSSLIGAAAICLTLHGYLLQRKAITDGKSVAYAPFGSYVSSGLINLAYGYRQGDVVYCLYATVCAVSAFRMLCKLYAHKKRTVSDYVFFGAITLTFCVVARPDYWAGLLQSAANRNSSEFLRWVLLGLIYPVITNKDKLMLASVCVNGACAAAQVAELGKERHTGDLHPGTMERFSASAALWALYCGFEGYRGPAFAGFLYFLNQKALRALYAYVARKQGLSK